VKKPSASVVRSLDRGSRWLLPLAVLAGSLALRFSGWSWVEGVQHRAFDAYLNIKPRPYDASTPVRVIDMDEDSLAKIGQFPWPRTKVAELVSRLKELGVAVVAFDVTFPEGDRTSPARVAASWPDEPGLSEIKARVSRLPDHDVLLAKAFRAANVVVGFAPRGEATKVMPSSKARFAYAGDGPLSFLRPFAGATDNLPVLDEAAAGLGCFGFEGEHDGVIRRAPMLWNFGGKLLPSLSLEALRVAQGVPQIAIKSSGASGEKSYGGEHTGIVKLKVGRFVVPTDDKGRVWVYYAKDAPGRTIPAWRVFDRKDPPSGLEGAIAFVGTSAAGLNDLRATPLNPAAAGVDVHANLTEQILTGTFLERPDWAPGAEAVFTAVFGLVLLALLALLGAVWSAPVGLGLIASAVWLSWHAFTVWHWLLDPVFPCASLAGVYASFAGLGYIRSERDRHKITDTFGRFVSPKFVAELVKNPGKVALGGETRELTVHFCDIRGFTTISEKFDPHGLTEFINRFLTPMSQIILDHDGTIDKYMGDCIMAFWNAPVSVPDHARKACAAALAMHARLAELNAQWQADAKAGGIELPEIHIGTGLNTGPVVAGLMGSMLSVAYSVLGDDVNLASRLEGQSKAYGVNIVIGPLTREQASDYATLELDLIKVKGKTRPVRIFTLLGDPAAASSEKFRALAKVHEEFLAAYRAQKWDDAERLLKEARGLGEPWHLGKFYDMYSGRLAAFRAEPPGPAWDGVFTATSK
jgi:adenylate cyclase